MLIEARAKINWAIKVVGTRADGYHLLDSLIQRIRLSDLIELTASPKIRLSVLGKDDLGDDTANLAYRAAQSLQAYSGFSGGALITLHKRIPIRAGLGGGSADAAAVLLGLNELWNLRLPISQLESIAVTLGADVPCCLYEGLVRVRGIGEIVEPIQGGKEYPLLLIQPGSGLSTKTVFERFDREPPPKAYDLQPAIKALVSGNEQAIKKHCVNQLQNTAVRMLPQIQEAIADLFKHKAVFAQMTGSGSCVFGLFSSINGAREAFLALSPVWEICLLTSSEQG